MSQYLFWIVFEKDVPGLLLRDVELKENVPVKGWVINGGWVWKWDGQEVLACNKRGQAIHREPCTEIVVLPWKGRTGNQRGWASYAEQHASEVQRLKYPAVKDRV